MSAQRAPSSTYLAYRYIYRYIALTRAGMPSATIALRSGTMNHHA